MSLNIVSTPYHYFGAFTKGKPVFNASIYVGEPDLDAADISSNQKQVTLRQEDGTEVEVGQPLATGSGGYISYNGSVATALVDGAYSIIVLDSNDNQIYYSSNVTNGEPITEDSDELLYRIDYTTDILLSTVSPKAYTTDYYDASKLSGSGSKWVADGTTGTPGTTTTTKIYNANGDGYVSNSHLIFNTKNNMVATGIFINQRVSTLGYTATADGGQSDYIVRVPQTVDEYGSFTVANNNVVTISEKGRVFNEQYGIIGDGDYPDELQALLDNEDYIGIRDGVFSTNVQLDINADNKNIKIFSSATIKASAAMDAVIYAEDKDNLTFCGSGKIDGNDLAVSVLECEANSTNATDLTIRDLEVFGTADDAQLFYGCILVGSLKGKAGPERYKNIRIQNVNARDGGTHGILVAYSDDIWIQDCEIANTGNHGSDAVNCTRVNMSDNTYTNCTLSGPIVSDNTQYFKMNNNIIIGCAGDGCLSIEQVSVNGEARGNTISDAKAQGINFSYGESGAGSAPFDTIHDVIISGNNIECEVDAATNLIGINCFATPSVPGYNINIENNTIEGFNRLMTLSWLEGITVSGVTNNSTQGTDSYLIDAQQLERSSIHNIKSKATLGDHAIQIKSYLTSESSRVSINNISAFSVNSGASSVVYLNEGNYYTVYDIESAGANFAIQVVDVSTTYQAGGIIGNYVGGEISGGTPLTWQAS